MSPTEFKDSVKATFPNGIKAISENDNFDFLALVGEVILNESDSLVFLLYPDVNKNFYLVLTDIEKSGDEWLVTTTTGRWGWRQPPANIGDSYIKAMKRDGFNV